MESVLKEFATILLQEGTQAIGYMRQFDDVPDKQSLAISLGYYYGFAKLYLSHLGSTGDEIVDLSIGLIDCAFVKVPRLAGLGCQVRAIAGRTCAYMEEQVERKEANALYALADRYLRELYDSPTIDRSKIEIAKEDMVLLQGAVSGVIKKLIRDNNGRPN